MSDYEIGMRDLDRMLIYIAKANGNHEQALSYAQAAGEGNRVITCLQKATVPSATTGAFGATGLGPAFGELYGIARSIGVADMLGQYAVRLPRGYGRYNLVASVIGSTVVEGAGRPVRRWDMSTVDIVPLTGSAQVVFSKELIDGLDAANAMQSVRRELVRGVVSWTDGALLTALTGNSSEAMSTDDVADFIKTDLEEALLLVGASSTSKLFLITTPAISKAIAVHLLTLGVNVDWPNFTIAGITVVASDQQTSGRATIVAADSVAMFLGEIAVRSSETATLEMDSAPSQTSGAAVSAVSQVSLFTSNSIALLATRVASFKPLTPQSHAHLTNIGFGTIDSPIAVAA